MSSDITPRAHEAGRHVSCSQDFEIHPAGTIQRIAELEAENERLTARLASARVGADAWAEVMDEYDAETRALPNQHEIPSKGCSTYNWRKYVTGGLREAFARRAQAKQGETQ